MTQGISDSTASNSNKFFGWWIATACFFFSMVTLGVISLGFTALFEPIATQFGWSYAQVSLASSIQSLVSIILLPLIGIIVDRYGTKRLLFFGVILICLGYVLLSNVNSLGMLYFSFVVLSLGSTACGGLTLNITLTYWFKRRLSLALGINSCGSAIGGLLIPVITLLVDNYDLKIAILIIAAGILVVLLPMAFVLSKKPNKSNSEIEDSDNTAADVVAQQNRPRKTASPAAPVKLMQILKNKVLILIMLAYLSQMLIVNAVSVHIMPYLSSIGINRVNSSLIASLASLCGILGSLGLGWLGIKMAKKTTATIAFAFTVVSLLLIALSSTVGSWVLAIYVVCWGISFGGTTTLQAALLKEYFGKNHFATIVSLLMVVIQIGGLLGPLIAGAAYDKWSSYQGIWFIFAGLALLSALCIIALPSINKIETHEPMLGNVKAINGKN